MEKVYYYKLYDKTCKVGIDNHYAYIWAYCGADLIARIQDFRHKYKIGSFESVGLEIFSSQAEWVKDALWNEKN